VWAHNIVPLLSTIAHTHIRWSVCLHDSQGSGISLIRAELSFGVDRVVVASLLAAQYTACCSYGFTLLARDNSHGQPSSICHCNPWRRRRDGARQPGARGGVQGWSGRRVGCCVRGARGRWLGARRRGGGRALVGGQRALQRRSRSRLYRGRDTRVRRHGDGWRLGSLWSRGCRASCAAVRR